MINPRPNFSLTWETDFDPNGGGGIPGAPQYAFAVNVSDGSLWYHSGVGAQDWIKIGSGSGGGPAIQIFSYEVTGSEPDLSEIAITIPTPMADANYGVGATCQGVVNVAAFDVVSKTPTGFTLIATGNLQAADVVTFYVGPLT